MNKIFFISIISFLALGIFSGCDDDDNKAIKVYGSKSKLNQTVYADDTEADERISFKTKGSWTSSIAMLQPEEDWIYIDPDKGSEADIYTIGIYLKPNYSGEDRAATITIKCLGESAIIQITQKGTSENTGNDDGSLTLSDPKEQFQQVYADRVEIIDAVHFDSSEQWFINIESYKEDEYNGHIQNDKWIDVDKREGEPGNNQTLSIYLSVNDTGEDREANITLYTRNHNSYKSIKILQKATTEKGGQPVDPAPSMEYSRYISKLVRDDRYSTYRYDSKNRLVSIIEQGTTPEGFDLDDKREIEFIYLGMNKIIKLVEKELNYNNEIMWENTYATYLLNTDNSISYIYEHLYQYNYDSNGYLSNLKTLMHWSEGEYEVIESITFDWQDGNLLYSETHNQWDGYWMNRFFYEYNHLTNNAQCNFDINKYIEDLMGDRMNYLNNYGGKGSENLIWRRTEEFNDHSGNIGNNQTTFEYTYEIDDQNCVTAVWQENINEPWGKWKIATIEYK